MGTSAVPLVAWPGAIVDDVDGEFRCGHGDIGVYLCGAGVFHRVGQCLLNDPIGGGVDGSGDCRCLAADVELHVQARGGQPLHQRREFADPGGRCPGGVVVVVTQKSEKTVDVAERGTSDLLDPGERLYRSRYIDLGGHAPGAGLHDHDVDRVPDGVVELACDPGAFVDDGFAGFERVLLLGLLRLHLECLGVEATCAHPSTSEGSDGKGGNRHHDRGEITRFAGNEWGDDDGHRGDRRHERRVAA